MMFYKKLAWTILLSLIVCTNVIAEEAKTEIKTKIEEFSAKTGVVIIRSFSTIASINGRLNSSIAVDSKEFINASTGQKSYGITIEVKSKQRIEREHTSYIDYDEIPSLIEGIDYIGSIDKKVTKLNNFQADYRTKGELEISTFSTIDNKTMVSVSSGTIGKATAYFDIEMLPNIKTAIQNAKAKLDSIK